MDKFTVIEAMTEKSDNGGDILISPGAGTIRSLTGISVSYDENTLFAIQTIYDVRGQVRTISRQQR